MADDIVERLRVIHCAADDLTPCGTCLPCQAADEIERLRAEVGRWVADFQDVFVLKCKADDEIERLQAENKRLRTAGDRLSAAVNAVSCSGPRDEMAELTDAFLDWEARRER